MKLLSKHKHELKRHLTIKVTREVTRASRQSIETVESVGGRITTVYYNRLRLRVHLLSHKFDIIPRRAHPPPSIMKYYLSFENRGYLLPEMQLLFVDPEMFKDVSVTHKTFLNDGECFCKRRKMRERERER